MNRRFFSSPPAGSVVKYVQIDDGRRVSIRQIAAADQDGLRSFFAALSPATRRLRFLCPIKEVPEELLHKLTQVDQRNHVAFIAEAESVSDQPPTIVAEARYARSASSNCAELALVVSDDWRHVGLGTSIARGVLHHAAFAGVRRLCGEALAENQAIRGLMLSFGARESRGTEPQNVQLCLEVPSSGARMAYRCIDIPFHTDGLISRGQCALWSGR